MGGLRKPVIAGGFRNQAMAGGYRTPVALWGCDGVIVAGEKAKTGWTQSASTVVTVMASSPGAEKVETTTAHRTEKAMVQEIQTMIA